MHAEIETLREENRMLEEKDRILREFVASAEIGENEENLSGAEIPERTRENIEEELGKLKKIVARERKAIDNLEKEAAKAG